MSSRRLVLLVTAAALVLRVLTLGGQSFWSDEAATATLLDEPLHRMVRGVVDGESTPPLFYVLDWLWTQLAGTGEVAARLPSALLGTATVPVVAALAARLVPARLAGRAAVSAAVLTAVGPLMVWYSQEARAYALLMLLTAGSVLALLRVLEAPTTGRSAAWAALAVAAFWTHHFALFPVVGEAAWLLWALRRRAAVAVGVVAALALALAPLLLHQRAAGRASFIAQESLGHRLAQLPKQVLVGYDGPAETLLTILGLLAVGAALAGLGPLLTRRTGDGDGDGPPGRAPAIVMAVAATGVLLPLLAALAGQDFILTRNLLGVLPLALALLAAGAAGAPRRAVGTSAVAVLAATGIVCVVAVATDDVFGRDDFRAAVRAAVAGPPTPRLVVADAASRVAVRLYLGDGTRVVTPGRPQAVREIDVVKLAGARPGGTRSTPEVPAGVVPAGFTVAEDRAGDTWAVRRFVAPAPVAVDPGSLAPLVPGGEDIVLARPR